MANEVKSMTDWASFVILLQLVFFALKLTGLILWPWWVVFLPFIVDLTIWVALALAVALGQALFGALSRELSK